MLVFEMKILISFSRGQCSC